VHDTVQAAERLRLALGDATAGLIGRDSLVELIALAAVAREHVLVIGPPGTAKSEAVRRISAALEGRSFEYLLGRFTEPSELFGPVDLRKLRDGVVETRTEGMLPEAEFAFLDEVFLGSTAILNTLLGILADRVFRRGHTQLSVNLRVAVGASNALPDDPALAAFSDRFLLRMFVEPIDDPRLEELLEAGWAGQTKEPHTASIADLDALSAAARQADLSVARPAIANAVRRLRGAGLTLSDRRVVKLQRLVAAAAVLAGRTQPTLADLWPIVYAVPDPEGQALAREVLREQLDEADNEALPAAAEHAAQGRAARARRIASAGEALLAKPQPEDPGWRLRVEGIAREIDAGFGASAMPETLAAL
jgi:MoxR-like ATPase